jgi:hypothetical protein
MPKFPTPVLKRLAIFATLAAGALCDASAAHAQWRADGYSAPPGTVCRYEFSRRGYGPTLQYVVVSRCYVDGVAWRPGRHHRGAIVLHSKG